MGRFPLALRVRAFYCQPGIEGAHEKGGVEGEIGWFRRNHLVPVPEVDSLAELNELVAVGPGRRPPADRAPRSAPSARTSPSRSRCWRRCRSSRSRPGCWLTPRVDRYAQVTVRTNRYSVPARLIGRQVRVLLHASELVVYDGRTEVARHERLIAKGGSRLELDHYLEALVRKPGALPGATALEQARAAGTFTAGPRRVVGGGPQGPRRRGRHPGPDRGAAAAPAHAAPSTSSPGSHAALRAGALTADAVALEARKAADTDVSTTPTSAGRRPAWIRQSPDPVA